MSPPDTPLGVTDPTPTIPHRHAVSQCFTGQEGDTKPQRWSGQHEDYAKMTALISSRYFYYCNLKMCLFSP
jgi:hypothetical protein